MLPPPPPSGHSQLMGNFMGAAQRSAAGNMPEPSARRTWGCRAALTSARQTICRSRCRTLPSPWGCGCVTPGLSTPQTPSTSVGTLAWSWGHNQRANAHCRDLGISSQK